MNGISLIEAKNHVSHVVNCSIAKRYLLYISKSSYLGSVNNCVLQYKKKKIQCWSLGLHSNLVKLDKHRQVVVNLVHPRAIISFCIDFWFWNPHQREVRRVCVADDLVLGVSWALTEAVLTHVHPSQSWTHYLSTEHQLSPSHLVLFACLSSALPSLLCP